jgi:hypothetical protein
MKTFKLTLIASAASLALLAFGANAAVPLTDDAPAFTVKSDATTMEARQNRGGDGVRGGEGNTHGGDDDDSDDSDDSDDDNSGSGHGGDDDNDDDNSGSGHGGDDDSSSDDSDDDGDDSNSGRRKPRIPGGSGCDDAQDVVEHAECRGTTG